MTDPCLLGDPLSLIGRHLFMSWRDGPSRDLAWDVFVMPGAFITSLGPVSIVFAVSRLFLCNKDFFSN